LLGLAAKIALFSGAGKLGIAEAFGVVRVAVFDHMFSGAG